MRLPMLMLAALDRARALARNHPTGAVHAVAAVSPGARDTGVKTR